MLKQRLLTAAVLIPLFLAALFLMSGQGFAIFLAVILVLSLSEWANLSAIQSPLIKTIYILVGVAIAVLIQYSGFAGQELFIAVFVLWCFVILRLVVFSRQDHTKDATPGNGSLAWLVGYFVLVPTVLGLLVLKLSDLSPQLLLIFFFTIWSADTGAYLAGRTWGKHKLAPAISPGKTIEGVLGGVVAALIAATLAGVLVLELPQDKLVLWLVAIVIVTLFSVAGDLFESVYKRRAGVKDSGKLLPGHGGVLDRIDSACAALPPFILVLYQFDLLANTGINPF
ncbi:MAG: phosphatidate cytidylyltransferase [Gammaproteobacteria bacterium]|nr:phosphatidate cytidylyltransferase [Gammaproteobacteria bacterium]